MSKQEFFIEDTDWAETLQEEYEEYLYACEATLDAEEPDEIMDTVSGEIFCGCQTCYTREQLFFLIPKIIKGYTDGKITLNEE